MRVSELKGKAVITAPGGENIGHVEDVLLRPVEQRLGALIVRSERFAGLQVLLAEDISSLGGDAVPARSAENLQDQTRFGEAAQMVSLAEASGRRVATASGNYAGELSDVHFDPATGKITGYEVTGGLFAKMFGHTHTIEASEDTRLGKDLLIVADKVIPAQSEEEVQPLVKG
ncbi:MAG: PRC-barrel domain-containing protein [Dehalococcoidia bacterium]|nr:PRC-barrel domain-containing protein [Dehalococcoidia bacterium]